MTKPLHVQVAEALGWTDLHPSANEAGDWGGTSPPGGDRLLPFQTRGIVPRFDRDWEDVGPLIEKYKIDVFWAGTRNRTTAWRPNVSPTRVYHEDGTSPCQAICKLIIRLAKEGVLDPSQSPPPSP